MPVTFKDNSMKISGDIKEAVTAFLEEAGGELVSQAQRTVRVDTGKTKGDYGYKVVESSESSEVHVGSDNKNAIYEEYGTGQYALSGNGRKTAWSYKDTKGNWHRTHGKKPTRPLHTSYTKTAPKIKKQLSNIIKSTTGG